ncbi:MAG TPA: hypothetical protein ENJ08_20270 [Gammaproteobacteria bacterium]|nr:hypothetical protein [Gammaproteobacteria bacterium]
MSTGNTGDQPTLRQRFLAAVRSGELGRPEAHGVELTITEFKAFFPDENRNYLGSFLSGAALEKGRTQMTYTQYLMRLRKGVYRVHPDVFEMQVVGDARSPNNFRQ